MNKSILEKYTIFSFLNKGASASVYMAMNNHTRRLVALKMIALDKTDPVIKEKALYEIEVMKKISNFFVVSLYDYYVDDDYVYIIMEYCENWARSKGCKQFASDCEINNSASVALHRKCGFAESARLVHFIKDI